MQKLSFAGIDYICVLPIEIAFNQNKIFEFCIVHNIYTSNKHHLNCIHKIVFEKVCGT